MIKRSRIFEVYEDKKNIYTKNLVPKKKVYDEYLINFKGEEYRTWNPRKSKLAAAIAKGSPNIFIRKGSVVLYLGSSTGTTVSHVSDIVGREGFIFALDLGPVVMRKMILNLKERTNVAPILASADKTDDYLDKVCMVDVIYQDIAQKGQVNIFLKNVQQFLKDEGYAILALKARSIDISKKPKDIFRDIKKELEKGLIIIDYRILEPFQKDHAFYICKKR